jgi:hypothetical protein
MVRELVEHGIDPDIKNRLGNTAAHDCWLFWRNPSGFQGSWVSILLSFLPMLHHHDLHFSSS